MHAYKTHKPKTTFTCTNTPPSPIAVSNANERGSTVGGTLHTCLGSGVTWVEAVGSMVLLDLFPLPLLPLEDAVEAIDRASCFRRTPASRAAFATCNISNIHRSLRLRIEYKLLARGQRGSFSLLNLIPWNVNLQRNYHPRHLFSPILNHHSQRGKRVNNIIYIYI